MKKKLSLALSIVGITVLVVYIAASCNKKDEFKPELNLNVTSLSVAALTDTAGNFAITSNTSWTVSSSQSWLIISPSSGSNNGTVTVTAQQNKDTFARTAMVTVSAKGADSKTVKVTQSGVGSVSKTSLSVAAEENSTGTFTITTDTSWTVSSSESWLTVTPTSGSKNGTITVTAQQNPDTSARIATVNVSAKGASSKTVTITQNGGLSVSKTSLTVGAGAFSKSTFTITSDTSWTVTSSQSWLTVSVTSGSKNKTIVVTATQVNPDTTARTATVTVSATAGISKTVTVTQSASKPTVSVSTTTLSVSNAASSTGTFTITANVGWTVSSAQSWLTVSPTSGTRDGNGKVTVTASTQNTGSSERIAAVTVSAPGATSKTVWVNQRQLIEVSGCTIPEMPLYSSLTTNSYLPDPFSMIDGSRITTKDQWKCRRAEIAVQAMEFEYGYKPNTPYSATTGSYSSNSITVTVTDNGTTISFACAITYPHKGSAPYPAMIACGVGSLNNSELDSLGVAVITFPSDQIAEENNSTSRGVGKFYDMYGSAHSAGALMAWAWGADRLIDALEKTPDANIDPTRLGVTGCSRWGKGALACGAFDERIKLTIPQESGSGGSASWRVSDWQGTTVQTLGEITGENVWFRSNFTQFNNTATKLPFDHHMIEALCAPRALLVIENTSMIWLGNVSTWTTGNVAHMVWEALGIPDMMGFSQVGNHNHCAFPSSQQPEVTAYVQKFLVGGGTGNTTIMKTDGSLTFDKAKWVNWTVPSLP